LAHSDRRRRPSRQVPGPGLRDANPHRAAVRRLRAAVPRPRRDPPGAWQARRPLRHRPRTRGRAHGPPAGRGGDDRGARRAAGEAARLPGRRAVGGRGRAGAAPPAGVRLAQRRSAARAAPGASLGALRPTAAAPRPAGQDRRRRGLVDAGGASRYRSRRRRVDAAGGRHRLAAVAPRAVDPMADRLRAPLLPGPRDRRDARRRRDRGRRRRRARRAAGRLAQLRGRVAASGSPRAPGPPHLRGGEDRRRRGPDGGVCRPVPVSRRQPAPLLRRRPAHDPALAARPLRRRAGLERLLPAAARSAARLPCPAQASPNSASGGSSPGSSPCSRA
jgi:hypothetical protein